ncbi:MAG: hypothetical protein ACYC27_14785 [Armatimonadota bacterium]
MEGIENEQACGDVPETCNDEKTTIYGAIVDEFKQAAVPIQEMTDEEAKAKVQELYQAFEPPVSEHTARLRAEARALGIHGRKIGSVLLPDPDQAVKMDRIVCAGKELAQIIIDTCPDNRGKGNAIALLEESVARACSAIIRND